MSILLVRVKAPEAANKESSVYLDFDFVRTTSSLLQHVQQLAWDLLPGAEEIKATYVDDEGDACSLTEQTVNDALSFAFPHGADEDTKILNISVHGMLSQKANVADKGEQELSSLASDYENDPALQQAGTSESVAALDHAPARCPLDAAHVFQAVERDFLNSEERMSPKNGPVSVFADQLLGRIEQGLHKEEQSYEPADRNQPEVKQRNDAAMSLATEPSEASEVVAKELPEVALEEVRTEFHHLKQHAEDRMQKEEQRCQETHQRPEQKHVFRVFQRDSANQKKTQAELQDRVQADTKSLSEAEERKHKEEQRYQEVQKLNEQRARMQSEWVESSLHSELQSQVLQQHSTILKAREDRARALAAQTTKASPIPEVPGIQSASKESDDANQQVHEIEEEPKTSRKKVCAAKQYAQQCAVDFASYKKEVDKGTQRVQQVEDESSKYKREADEASLRTREIAEESVRCKKELVEAKLQLQELSSEIAWFKCEREEADGQLQVALSAKKAAEESRQEIADGFRSAAEKENNAKEAIMKDLEQAHHSLSQEQKLKQEAQLANACIQQVLEEAQLANMTAQQDIQALRAEFREAVERAEVAEEKARKGKWMGDVLGLSASVETCFPLTLGVEAEDDAAARGDATSELAELVSSWQARQAFRIGRIRLAAAPGSAPAPACARVAVRNDGTVAWPGTTVVVNVKGDDMGLPVMALRALKPGEVTAIEMDLEVPSNPMALSEVRSSWAIVDAATGACLGPLLVFEVAWDLA